MRLAALWVAAIFQGGSACFAVYAAWLWWKSALIKTPETFPIYVVSITGVGTGHSPAINELGNKLGEQSALSARAAMLTGISAV